jgi:hypothetical protein
MICLLTSESITGTASVRLVYRPVMRTILEFISLAALIIISAYLAGWLAAGWIKKPQKIYPRTRLI